MKGRPPGGLPHVALRYACASVLIRRKHPRWAGMRVGFKDLTAWSFLMASQSYAQRAPAAFRMYGEESPEYDYNPDDAPREQVERAALPARSRP